MNSKNPLLILEQSATICGPRYIENISVGLQHVTKNLNEFIWNGFMDHSFDSINLINTFRFSNKLKTLRIYNAYLDPRSFPVMLNSIGMSLKELEVMDTGFNEDQDAYQALQSEVFEIVIKTLVNLETLSLGYKKLPHDYFFSNANSLDAPPHQNLHHLLLPWCSEFNLSEISSVSTVVKWFPNLTLLSLCFGEKNHSDTKGVSIRLPEVVGKLSDLKQLKDLCLRVCSPTVPGDLQKTLRALKHIPRLLCCTLVELDECISGNGKCKSKVCSRRCKKLKTTLTLENLRDELKELGHLSIIRLIGFKFKLNCKEKFLDFAKENGINLELYQGFLDLLVCMEAEDKWFMSTTGAMKTENFVR